MTPEISVRELHRKREAGEAFVLLDVREADELAMASLSGALHVPMGDVAARLTELPRDSEIVVMCHSGVRSEHVTRYLQAQGFERVANLAGGIDAWSYEIDPSVPAY